MPGDTSRQPYARTKLRPQVRTAGKKAAFLAAFREHGVVGPAAVTARIARQTVYVWQEHDEAFAAAFNAAREEAIDVLEHEAYRRAVVGVGQRKPITYRGEVIDTYVVTEYSDRLLELALKAARPAKYRERIQLQHADADGQKFPLAAIRQALGIGLADGD